MTPFGKKPIGTIAYMGGVMAVPEPFAWSWGQMVQYNAEYLCEPNECVHYCRATISIHSAARNSIVQQFKGDWLLMLDTDHVFDPDIAARMVFKMNKYHMDVLSGIYHYKSPPYAPVLYTWAEDGERMQILGDWERPDPPYFIPVAAAGAGCLMVRRSVFQCIKEELKEEPFDITPPFGEDMSFFRRLKKLGIQAYCDPALECNHLRLHPVSSKDYNPAEQAINYPDAK